MVEETNCIELLRGIVNDSDRVTNLALPDNKKWNQLCTSMDMVDDCDYAIFQYSKLDNVGYLELYGLLQALFLQQDATIHIAKAVGLDVSEDEFLIDIRNVRNDVTGHPTNSENGKSFIYLDRHSISKSQFVYRKHISAEARDEKIKVNVSDLLRSQSNGVNKQLKQIHDQMCEIENKHREEHREMKLAEVFPPTIGYLFSKIFESAWNDEKFDQAIHHIEIINSYVYSFKEKMEEREEWFSDLQSELEQFSYATERLNYIYNHISSEEVNRIDIDIYCTYMDLKVKGFIDVAKQIDDQYMVTVA